MKDRRRGSVAGSGGDRFAVFPFSMGCMSQSAVSVADPAAETSKKPPQSEPSSSSSSSSITAAAHDQGGVVVGDSSSEAAANAKAEASPAGPGGLVAAGVSRLMKGIRSLSQMFAAAYDDGGEEEEEEEEREIVIGYPTDVQHVGHIGWDGGNHTKLGLGATAMGMVNAFSLPSTLSLHQLEMAMDQHHHAAAQA
ncbi:hypothetical protein U9M48_011169 [Paspalum notatum var. saurae]|uniref:CRIB domain-containing protein n=1 Tax=Paspalum notatum var. saurae TaxID=547442 RepID=A0AAQ3SV43_PASNO